MCIYNCIAHQNMSSLQSSLTEEAKNLKGYYENHLFGIVLYNNGFT